MKRQTFWKIGLSAALIFGLNACSSTSSIDEEEDDEDEIALSSSSGKKTSSSSSAKVSSSSKKGAVKCDTVSATLASPSSLTIAQNGETSWVLLWNYTDNDNRPENGFVIETLNMSDSIPKWKTMDSTNVGVTIYNLTGASKAGRYYRIMAKDECGYSKPTDMMQVSASGSTATGTTPAAMAVPANLKLDTLENNKWQLSWSYTNNPDRPEEGFKLQSLDLSASSPKWVDADSTNKGVRFIIIDGNKKGGLMYHVAAKDFDGRLSEYSAEIRIPIISDSPIGAKTSNTELAVPSSLKFDSLGQNKWQLSWTYTNNSARPEEGFTLQALDLSAASPKWTTKDSTNKGVRFIILDATTMGGKFIRVAAKDSKGISAYSEEISVPKAKNEAAIIQDEAATLATPTNLKTSSLGDNKWQVSWSYTNNKNRPENGFKLQVLDMNDATPQWKDYKTVNSGVHYITVNAATDGEKFIRVAAKDSSGISEFSAEIQIPKFVDTTVPVVELATPTNLKLDSIGDGIYRLTWSFENNKQRPENGFVLQSLDPTGTNPTWEEKVATTKKGVQVYNIDAHADKDGGKFFRVAAKDANNEESEYSVAIAVPVYSEGAINPSVTPLNIPTNLTLTDLDDNKWRISWSYTNNPDRPENGFVYEFLDMTVAKPAWAKGDSTSKGVRYIVVDAQNDGGKFVRVAAKDANGNSEFSSEIQIPAYVDKSVSQVELAVPTDLKLDSINVGKFQLTWSYTDNAERPENGFVLQSLKPGDSEWTDSAATAKKGVHVIVIDALANDKENSGKFYRVAAVDKNGARSKYSTEIQIPIVNDDGTSYTSTDKTPLAVPTNLAVENLGGNKYKISWDYKNNESRPETQGFVLEKLDASATSPKWEEAGATNKGVHFIVITLAAGTPEMTYRVAAKDSRGISEFSSTIVVPKFSVNAPADGCSGTFAAPSGLKAERIAPNVWRIIWNYSQNTKCLEEKFIIQKVDVDKQTNEWKEFGTTQRNVHYLNLEGSDNLNFYYRVAAVRGDDTTTFSNEALLTRNTAYSSEVAFRTPSIGTLITAGGVKIGFTIFVKGNYPNHTMLNSEYTDKFQYQFRWNNQVESEWKTVDVTKDGEYEVTQDNWIAADEFCYSYASVRTIWIDKDGNKDYTEWSEPVGPMYGNVKTKYKEGDEEKDLCPMF